MSALAELALRADPSPIPILEISERRAIPLHVLEQLFAALRRAGILRSQRGVKGGYAFLRPAREVTVLDVVECVDGPVRAAVGPAPAPDVWADACGALAEVLAAVTIADIVEREASATDALMFHI